MSQKTDWMPGARDGILAMAKDWQAAAAPKAAAWNIPQTALQQLGALAQAAETALAAAKKRKHPRLRGDGAMQSRL